MTAAPHVQKTLLPAERPTEGRPGLTVTPDALHHMLGRIGVEEGEEEAEERDGCNSRQTLSTSSCTDSIEGLELPMYHERDL